MSDKEFDIDSFFTGVLVGMIVTFTVVMFI